MRRSSSALRRRLTGASFLLSLVLVSGAVGALAVLLAHETASTIEARLQERGAALAATVGERHGRVDVTGADESLFDGPNWVFSPSRVRIEGPAAGGALGRAVAGLAASRAPADALEGPWHLRAVPVRAGDRVVAVAVTGVDEQPYLTSAAATIRAAVLLGLLAVAGATGLAALVLSRSLNPIAGMTARAAEWSRADGRARFASGPPKDEITALAVVLDELLDRVDAALQAERRLTAEIAHELRTPLTLVIGEAQLALMSPTTSDPDRARYGRIETAAGSMARAITVLLESAAAASAGGAATEVAEVVGALQAEHDGGPAIRLVGGGAQVGVPPALLERMLLPLISNASTAGAGQVAVRAALHEGRVRIEVQDDGVGVPDAVAQDLFTAGVSGRPGGTGLGLALARRLAEDVGGGLRLQQQRPATFLLTLPPPSRSG